MRMETESSISKRWEQRRIHWQLYLMILPALAWLIIFCYVPMYGVVLAFKDYSFSKGILCSDWVGFTHFARLFKSYWFPTIMKNTLTISLLSNGIVLNAPEGGKHLLVQYSETFENACVNVFHIWIRKTAE